MNCPDCGKEFEHDQDCPRKQVADEHFRALMIVSLVSGGLFIFVMVFLVWKEILK